MIPICSNAKLVPFSTWKQSSIGQVILFNATGHHFIIGSYNFFAGTEIPKSFKFNHRSSGNSISFRHSGTILYQGQELLVSREQTGLIYLTWKRMILLSGLLGEMQMTTLIRRPLQDAVLVYCF
ncbi:hypothetical protein CMV_023342 [Castanea mollissima]|uniref:Uncharacterized protein n=1 Tax=Castanea mollissima TaxID=60419 RepID=A0A8J4QGP4_9ROSI|nr:hypothetical protein CMV_023342 [Castanea mollissima]